MKKIIQTTYAITLIMLLVGNAGAIRVYADYLDFDTVGKTNYDTVGSTNYGFGGSSFDTVGKTNYSNTGFGGGVISGNSGWGGSVITNNPATSWGLTSYVTTPISYNTPSYSWNTPSYSNTNFSWTTPNFGGNTCNTSAGYYSSGSSCILYCQNTGNYVNYPNTCPRPTPLPTPLPTPVYECDNANGYYLTNSSCVKHCTNGINVVYPNQCGTDVPTPRVCNADGGYFLSNNICIKNCPNNVTVQYPNQCPNIPPVQQCDTANGYYLSNGSCMKNCINSTTVQYPNQCPNTPPVQQCDTPNGYFLSNGTCIKNCPNGGAVTQPNQCPIIPPTTTCDNANDYYYNLSTCVKFCVANNGYVTYPNQCPNTPLVQQCDTANGYYLSNGSCVKNCQYGGTVVYPNQCQSYNPQPVPQPQPIQQCDTANGYYYNFTSCVKYCSSTNGYVTYPNTCPINYIPVPVPTPTQNQTCYDGSIISAFSVCPSSFQVCPDGSMISRYSVCPVIYQPPVVRPQMVVNNVITSIPTQITNTSARCNGIGLIGNNLSSVAWFEYGTSQNLGSKTAVANIGSAETSPFTNLLTGLRPNTDYFCRAVMANDLGVIKGDIVHFTTKRVVVYYPTTIVKKVTHTVKKTVVVKKEIICSDGSAVETSNGSSNSINISDSNSALSMLESGKKSLSLTIVKTKGDVAPNEIVDYFIEFKNESATNLTDATVTVTLPSEMTLLKSNTGSYDTRTHEIVVAYPVLAPGQSSTLEIEVGVAKEAFIGKSVAVQVHGTYSIPPMTQKGKVLKDEVVAYAVATIVSSPLHDDAVVPAVKEKKDAPTATSSSSFLPNTVIEWVALFAIFLIIIILVRSIRESYKGDTTHH